MRHIQEVGNPAGKLVISTLLELCYNEKNSNEMMDFEKGNRLCKCQARTKGCFNSDRENQSIAEKSDPTVWTEKRGGSIVKRIWTLLLCVVLSFSLSACAENNLDTMYIEEAQLTEEEKNIAELLGLNQEYRLYDFTIDDTVKSMRINTYELVDGEWHIVAGGGGQAFEDSEGRLALGFENIADGLRIAIQSEHRGGSTSYFAESKNDITGMGYATSTLSDKKRIAYDQEIPLVIQIITSKNEVHSYMVDYFFQPEEYEKYDYEYVYAITVLFSQKSVSELEN